MTSSHAAANLKTVPIQWVDVIRFISAFLVVLAHVADLVYLPWFWGSFYYTLSRVAVPVFFMASGYLLLARQEEIQTFFRKRFFKVVIPFLFWSVLYEVAWNTPFEESGITLEAFASIFIRIINSPRVDHLWFFYSLIGLYLLTPVLRVFVSKAKDTDLLYFIALWFLAKPLMLLLEGYTPIRNGFDLFYTGGYVGYFLLGHYLGRLQINRRILVWAWAAFFLGMTFTVAVFYLDLPPVDNELILRDYPSLNIVIMSLGGFVLLKRLGEKAPIAFARLAFISNPYIFGIYLIHPFILYFITEARMALGFDPYTLHAFFMAPLLTMLTFGLCWALIYLAHKVPVLRSIV